MAGTSLASVGNGGIDTVTLPGNPDDFLIEPIEGGFRFAPFAGGEPIDIEFIDTTLFRDESLEARQMFLIYPIFLDREADGPGLAFWVDDGLLAAM